MLFFNKCLSSEVAFTFLELCLVIAVVGILSAIAIPSYISWKPKYQFRCAVSKMQRELNSAKMRAVEIGRQCRVQACGADYQVIDGDRNMASDWSIPGTRRPPSCPMTHEERAAFHGAGRRVYQGSVAEYYQVTVVAGTVDPTFSPRGTASPSSFTIHHPAGELVKVNVNIVGRIRIAWQ